MRCFAALVLLPSFMFLPFIPGPVQARDALDWLSREPVTLLDWGMTRLRGDLHDTVDGLSRDLRTEVSRSGVFYRFQDRRIVAYANFVDLPRNRTEEVCKDVYTRLAGALVRGGPQGAGGAAWYLESVFSHDSQGGDRPQDLGDQLADKVVLQVTIGPKPSQAFDDGRRITCTGRLDATPENIALKSEG
ncbi:hypothetical protein [Azospirillum sp. Marseille-Q6669]